jgi:hypothetical protein
MNHGNASFRLQHRQSDPAPANFGQYQIHFQLQRLQRIYRDHRRQVCHLLTHPAQDRHAGIRTSLSVEFHRKAT